MRILFDSEIFTVQKYGGISRYFTELVTRLAENDQFTPIIPLRETRNAYLRKTNFYLKNLAVRHRPWREKLLYNSALYVRIARKALRIAGLDYTNAAQDRRALTDFEGYDIFHMTYYNRDLARLVKEYNKKLVVTAYDMIHELYPEIFPVEDDTVAQKKACFELADKIVCISKNTEADLNRLYPVTKGKSCVVYLASSNELRREKLLDNAQCKEPFIFFVGTRSGYKGFSTTVNALYELHKMGHNNLQLVCAGGGGFSDLELAEFEAKGLSSFIKQRNLHDNDLYDHYQKAVAFLFPSHYEGFGIPVLESMGCGCPTVIADQPCLREIGGMPEEYNNAVETMGIFPIDDGKACAQIVDCLIKDKVYRQRLVENGFNRFQEFSWDKMASETMNVYKSIKSSE